MYRLEVIRNGEVIVTEYCVDWRHLRGTMNYYIGIRPDQEYRLYNDITGELIDGYM